MLWHQFRIANSDDDTFRVLKKTDARVGNRTDVFNFSQTYFGQAGAGGYPKAALNHCRSWKSQTSVSAVPRMNIRDANLDATCSFV